MLDQALREHVLYLLKGGGAHLNFDGDGSPATQASIANGERWASVHRMRGGLYAVSRWSRQRRFTIKRTSVPRA